MLGAADQMPHQRRSDETRSAGDDNLHQKPSGADKGRSGVAVIGERAVEIFQQGKTPILVGESDDAGCDRPGHGDVRIVPANAAFVRRRVIRRHFIVHDDVVFQREKSVCKAGRNVKLMTGFSRQFRRNMLAEGRRATANIDRDIENSAAQHADQLGLRGRRRLEMQAAQRAGPFRVGLVVLDEAAIDAERAQPRFVKGLDEPAALVEVPLGNDQAREAHRTQLHSLYMCCPYDRLSVEISNGCNSGAQPCTRTTRFNANCLAQAARSGPRVNFEVSGPRKVRKCKNAQKQDSGGG